LYDFSTLKAKTDGEDVVYKACAAPMTKILENANLDIKEIAPTLKTGQAYNVMTEKPVLDFIAEGLVDAVDIEMWALKNAVSVATGMISTGFAIVDLKPEKKDK
jgi:chaperonin GroEL (HSP60 family)